AARKCLDILENTRNVIAIEYMCASQGVDLLAPLQPSDPLKEALAAIREVVSTLDDDRVLYPDIVKIREIMALRKITSDVEEVTGPLLEG
ncbi:MAG: aromatic amino acid lyase, partial [Promethearchaeota archaeon]